MQIIKNIQKQITITKYLEIKRHRKRKQYRRIHTNQKKKTFQTSPPRPSPPPHTMNGVANFCFCFVSKYIKMCTGIVCSIQIQMRLFFLQQYRIQYYHHLTHRVAYKIILYVFLLFPFFY